MKFLTSTFKATADASPPKHAVAFVNGDQYYGAKASINVWTVCHSYWLSLVSDLLGKHSDLMEGFSSFWERCENIGYRGVLNGNERCHIGSSFNFTGLYAFLNCNLHGFFVPGRYFTYAARACDSFGFCIVDLGNLTALMTIVSDKLLKAIFVAVEGFFQNSHT
ncbi:hypothetical protein Tco_0284821 [Tanacetum coccineum]